MQRIINIISIMCLLKKMFMFTFEKIEFKYSLVKIYHKYLKEYKNYIFHISLEYIIYSLIY